jgi:hypothetical protein
LVIPENIEIIDTPVAINWLDENGLICSVSKNSVPSIKDFDIHFNALKKIGLNKKRPFLVDPTLAKPLNSELRRHLNEKLNEVMSCAAFITENKMMKIAVNIYFRLRPNYIPMKMFSNFDDAKEWLLNKLKEDPSLIS